MGLQRETGGPTGDKAGRCHAGHTGKVSSCTKNKGVLVNVMGDVRGKIIEWLDKYMKSQLPHHVWDTLAYPDVDASREEGCLMFTPGNEEDGGCLPGS